MTNKATNEITLTKRELVERLLAGEKLYTDRNIKNYVVYDEDYSNPFRFVITGNTGESSLEMDGVWSRQIWYTKTEWYENIPPKGVLCWVWDHGYSKSVNIVTRYNQKKLSPFMGNMNCWQNATPIRPEECYADD
mgnify:CR=1 FL=1|tara:strand:- start:450 stop:854 length:405 start_codon:yes stop_codon:yes gene_type:complete